MASPTDDLRMETCGDVSDVPVVGRSLCVGVASANFKVTGIYGIVENAKVNVSKLYLRQISAGCDMNQSYMIEPNAVTGLGKIGVNNWGVYDGLGSLVAMGQGMHTLAGKWSNWFTLVFVVEKFKGSTLQVMGANDDNEENEWAIVGGTGEFAMARGIIKRRVHSFTSNTITLELTIEFFCRMKEIKFGPSEYVKQISGAGYRGNPSYLCQFKIITNYTTYGAPLGTWEGIPFSFTVPENETVVGFFGSNDNPGNNWVTSIGVYTISK